MAEMTPHIWSEDGPPSPPRLAISSKAAIAVRGLFPKKDTRNDSSAYLIKTIKQVQTNSTQSSPINESTTTSFGSPSKKDTRKCLKKVDFRVIGPLSTLYQFSFIDRSNFMSAQKSTETLMDLSQDQYTIAFSVFFITFAIFGIFSSVMLRKIRHPARWLAFVAIVWGGMMTLQAAVRTPTQLIVVRLLLGAVESAILPAVVCVLSHFYTPYDLGRRLAFIVGSAILAQTFQRLLSFGSKQASSGALPSWQMKALTLGGTLIIIGAILPWWLPDTPGNCKWLSPEQKELLARRIDEQPSCDGVAVYWQHLMRAFFDPKIWPAVLTCFCCTFIIYGYQYSLLPALTLAGIPPATAHWLPFGPYVTAAFATFGLGWISDKKRTRSVAIITPLACAMVPYIVLLAISPTENGWLHYAILFGIPICGKSIRTSHYHHSVLTDLM